MKIVLISPYPDINAYGVRILSACLKQAGYEVLLLFLPQPFYERFDDSVLNEVVELSRDADLVGISLMTNFFNNSVQITKKIKEELGVPVVWGGVHPTLRPNECLEHADVVCVGEGEYNFIELIERLKKNELLDGIKGLWFKKGEQVIPNGVSRTEDLDSLPFPDYEYESHYILEDDKIIRMDEDILKKHLENHYLTLPSRGCPYSCTFCANDAYNENARILNVKTLRKRSIDNVIEECMWVKETIPFYVWIKFDDDAFFFYKLHEMEEFATKYKEKVGRVLGISGATPQTLRRDKVEVLVNAGLKWLRVGIQSGNDRIKEMYLRNYENEQVLKAANIIKEFTPPLINPLFDIILDNPWETEEEEIETLKFLMTLPIPYNLNLFSLTFYPGTSLYYKAKTEGIIKNEREDVYDKHYHKPSDKPVNNMFMRLDEYARAGDAEAIENLKIDLEEYEKGMVAQSV